MIGSKVTALGPDSKDMVLPASSIAHLEPFRLEPFQVHPVGRAACFTEVFGISRASLVEGHGFKIPDPDGRPQGSASAPVMAMVGSSKKPLLLPPSGTGEIWSVVIGENEQKPVDVAGATKVLREAVKQGGRAWVVVEPPAPEKPAKGKSKATKPRSTVRTKSKN